MKFRIHVTSAGALLAAILPVMSAGANVVAPASGVQVETLPDGNVRDPQPTAEELHNFLVTGKKNLVSFPGGSFEMGDWGPEVNRDGLPFDGSRDSKPLHKVTLNEFSIGKYPVTYAEFDVFTAALRLPRINQEDIAISYRKPDSPASVTWQGAKDYCQWLGKQAGQAFDLPTEAQWEYAARSGGRRHLYPTDNGKSEPGRNLPSYEQRQAAGGLVSVSSFPPNQAGMYYMSAGVQEWVNDWYDAKYYEISPAFNPTGPKEGTEHVARGFAGSSFSAMTIKRWEKSGDGETGTWSLYGKKRGEAKREIPFTKYTNSRDSAFRCVLNHPANSTSLYTSRLRAWSA
jgi:formylglycine-generating enzyme required for sulfatase activity